MKGRIIMNFYNPYYFPYSNVGVRTGLFSNLIKRINFSSIMNGTERTLNAVNQIIPLIKQAKPMMNNAKTMFKLMSEFSRDDENGTKKVTPKRVTEKTYNDGPTFFQ